MGGVELTSNGKPLDLADQPETQVSGSPPSGEQGSAYGGSELLFGLWQDGQVLATNPATEENFADMLRMDGKARTLEQVLTLPLLSAEWFLEPAEGDSGETKFVRESLTRPANAGGMTTPLELVIAQMASAIVYRRAYFEKVFKPMDGRVVYHKLAFRPARTCWLLRDKRNYSFQGFKQKFMREGTMVEEKIKPVKAFVYIHGQNQDQLNGSSDLETAYSIWETKQKVRFLWYSFLENQVIPKAIAKGRESQKLAEKVATLKGGGVVGIGPEDSVEAFESSGQAGEVFKSALDYLDAEMAGSVLAGFTQLPNADGVGSYALSKDLSDFFLRSRMAVLGEMGQGITSWICADLVRWNFGTTGKAPAFKFKPLAEQSTAEALEMFKTLTQRVAPDPRIPDEFLDQLTAKVAAHLGMDTEKVRKAIEGRSESSPTQRLERGISAAASLVQEAGLGEPAPA